MTKTALITGGTSGIGTAIARMFVDQDWNVVFCAAGECDVNDQVLMKIGHSREVDCIYADLSHKDCCKNVVDSICEKYGRIDVLINAHREKKTELPILYADPEQFRKTVEMNLMSAVYMSYHVSQQMIRQKGGTIINLSAAGGLLATGTDPAFHATMSALNLVTKTTSKALAPFGVRVVSVEPDPLLDDDTHAGNEVFAKKGEDLANLIRFLCSPQAAALNASTIVADNGYTSWR